MREHRPDDSADTASRRSPGASPVPRGHLTEVTERGSFSHASCACGWRGPARRARDRARADATSHTTDLAA